MMDATAGDPVSGIKWSRKSTERIARELRRMGIRVSANSVARLLKAQSYSLRKNRKNIESPTGKPPDPQRRDQQFRYIRRQRRDYETQGLPVISIDTKSRELIGRFHQSGQRWSPERIDVFDHDFPSAAEGVAIPYGIYDLVRNEGFISIGVSKDTSVFAVDSLRWWWTHLGRNAYPQAQELLILADGGGSNSHRTRLWKHQLQERFANPFGITVRLCHYPPGASKWNPIEHRLFGPISTNWAAQPLENYETVLKFIRTTRTQTGLTVCARLNRTTYEAGIRITDAQMQQILIQHARVNPQWNYTIEPKQW
jgi:hypothetical protein